MRRLVLFMHTSLDGFVGGPNGEMDWIDVNDEMFDYAGQRTREADTALYGRVTYQMMESSWPTAADQPTATKHDIEHSNWYNSVEIIKLKQAAGKDIVMFGRPTVVHALMTEDLIDDYWLFINPVLLGQGIPLFEDIKARAALRLVTSNVFSSGVVCPHYEGTPT